VCRILQIRLEAFDFAKVVKNHSINCTTSDGHRHTDALDLFTTQVAKTFQYASLSFSYIDTNICELCNRLMSKIESVCI